MLGLGKAQGTASPIEAKVNLLLAGNLFAALGMDAHAGNAGDAIVQQPLLVVEAVIAVEILHASEVCAANSHDDDARGCTRSSDDSSDCILHVSNLSISD